MKTSTGVLESCLLASCVLAVITSIGCGSAWCPLCPEEDEEQTLGNQAGSGDTGAVPPVRGCPTTPEQGGFACETSGIICSTPMAGGVWLGCTCEKTPGSSTSTWQCGTVVCPDDPRSGDACSPFLVGETCRSADTDCICGWSGPDWIPRWTCP
ncbi:MAG: hypothetical protein ACOC1F_11550 [Myxococcota bacterium]